jgi:mono/diheme cytochrome c family protein
MLLQFNYVTKFSMSLIMLYFLYNSWPELRAAQQQMTGAWLAWPELGVAQQEAPEESEVGGRSDPIGGSRGARHRGQG